MINFGIIGCGTIAQIHALAINQIENANILGAVDPDLQNAKRFSAQWNCKLYHNIADMLSDKCIDVVTICTPSGTHAQIAIQAAKAGKHVIIEKPMAISAEDAKELVKVKNDTKVQISVVSQLRFSPPVQSLKNSIDNGQLGKIVISSLSMWYYRSKDYYANSSWRGKWETDGGGALMNQGIHGLDLLCYLCGPVKSVRAYAKTLYHNIEVEDTLCAALEFKSGALGVINVSTAVHPGRERTIDIGGTKGNVTLTENAISTWNVSYPLPQKNEKWNSDSSNDPKSLDPAGHIIQIKNMIDAIEKGDKLLIDVAEGARIVELICGIYKSAQTGETIVLEV